MNALRRGVLKVASNVRASSGGGHQSSDKKVALWRNLFFFVGVPAVVLAQVNVILYPEEHTRPEFIKYDHLRIYTKRFPWGDGVKSFFYNPHTNALPDGYEDEEH